MRENCAVPEKGKSMRELPEERIIQDYGTIRPGAAKGLRILLEGAALGCAVCWLCYNDPRTLPLAALIAVLFFRMRKKGLIEKRRKELLYHFRDMITSLHAALRAGYSVENAVGSAARDIEVLYGKSDVLSRELSYLVFQLRLRRRIEELFRDMGERSGLEDIRMFAQLLAVGKKTGGNLSRVLSQTSQILCEKIDTEMEIDTLLSAKKFEQKIMSLMPAAIILYMRLSFPGFIETLYGNLFGAAVMTVCLLVYAAAFLWGKQIVRVDLY